MASPLSGRAGSRRLKALLALASPLLILLALVTVAIRPGSDRIQALPALAIGAGLLTNSWWRRRRRRHEILRALRQP
jgi:beta-galactosidase GanA